MATKTVVNIDDQISARLKKRMVHLLDMLEKHADSFTIPQEISAMIALGRLQVMFVALRKEDRSDGRSGSAIRKYSTAFAKKNAAGRGKSGIGLATAELADALADDAEDGTA